MTERNKKNSLQNEDHNTLYLDIFTPGTSLIVIFRSDGLTPKRYANTDGLES